MENAEQGRRPVHADVLFVCQLPFLQFLAVRTPDLRRVVETAFQNIVMKRPAMRWTLPQAEGKLGALQRALGNLLIFAKFAVYAAGWAILSWDMFIAANNTSAAVGWVTTVFLYI